MIVRNEAKVIRRCLESALPLIACWCICDTGSDDGTQQIIRETLRGIPGELHEDPWVNFGHNRSLAMQRARGKADYHLLLDADMVLCQHAALPTIAGDQYLIRFEGPCDYSVPRLVSDRHEWTYHGVTHEYIHSPTAADPFRLPELTIVHHEDGGGRPQRYQRDTTLLEEGLKSDPGNVRYHYYLAQCYRDSGRYTEALEWYEKRVRLGGWNQEVWSALYQMGRIQEHLGYDWRVVFSTYLQAYNFRPARLEPVYRIARFFRMNQQFSLGHLFSRLMIETAYPDDILFIERDVYSYGMALEHAICCFGTGRLHEATQWCHELLKLPNLPTEVARTVWELARSCGVPVPPVVSSVAPTQSPPATSAGDRSINTQGPCGDSPASRPDGVMLAFVAPGWWEAG